MNEATTPRLESAGFASDPDDLVVGGPRGGTPKGLLVLAVVVALVVVGGIVFATRSDSPGRTALGSPGQGANLGVHSDAHALGEELAPRLEAAGSGERVDPASVPCGDSEAALPEDGAQLVYSARLDWEGTPAVVLGYRVDGPSLDRLLLVLAADDCRLIVTQSF